MMFQPLSSVGVAALSCVLVFLSGDVLASTDSSMSPCVPRFFSDGDCDLINNTEECEYDGGDCCECTCVTTGDLICGEQGGFACVDPSAPCVDDDSVTSLPTADEECLPDFISDGDCDLPNNTEACGYDGGDCCECTCVSTDAFTCGDAFLGGFACIDPSAECVDDDFEPTDDMEGSMSFSPCVGAISGDGDCDKVNNNDQCGYDDGDCCECDCVSGVSFSCEGDFDCINPNSPCFNDYVDAGTKTTVGVSANAYDTRPGDDSDDVGCMEDGCLPALARDGDYDDVESRWSCAQKIVPEGGRSCQIAFTFEDPQDIKDVQVAFWRNEVRSRKLEVTSNGEDIGSFDSVPQSTFTSLGMEKDNVTALSLTSIGIDDDEWISIIEVVFLVEA